MAGGWITVELAISSNHLGSYIGGKWVSAADGRTFEVRNPATDERLAEVADCGLETVEAAAEAAHRAFGDWADRPAAERGRLLMAAAAVLAERKEHLARLLTLEAGKPIVEARAELQLTINFFQWYGEEAKRVYGEIIPHATPDKRHFVVRQPVGVVAAITPWNFPSAMVARKIAPALAAGCTVVVKPAEQTPLSAIAIFEILEAVGFPAGVVNLITASEPAPVGEALLRNPLVRKITFTGSTEVGKFLMRGAADQLKRVSLELGGHAPFIVFEDADLEEAAAGAVVCKFRNMGQTCVSANRIFIQRSVAEQFVARLLPKVQALPLGNPLDEATRVGPLIDRQGFEKVARHVHDARERGAEVLLGGRPANPGGLRGFFFEPTVLFGVRPDMSVACEETFGPVAPVMVFDTEEEVIQRANDTSYGLAAYVYTNDLRRAIRVTEKLEYGVIGINDPIPAVAHAPFGGWKQSGMGREGGRHGIDEFLEVKYLSVKL